MQMITSYNNKTSPDDLNKKEWSKLLLDNCNFKNQEFKDKKIEYTLFNMGQFYKIRFEDTVFSHCDFSFATIVQSVFLNCEFDECILKGALVKGCSLQGTKIIPQSIKTFSAFEVNNFIIRDCDITNSYIVTSRGGVQIIDPFISPIVRKNIDTNDPTGPLPDINGSRSTTFKLPFSTSSLHNSNNRSGATFYSGNTTHTNSPRKTRAVASYSNPKVFKA